MVHSKFSLVGISVHVVLVIPSMMLVSTKIAPNQGQHITDRCWYCHWSWSIKFPTETTKSCYVMKIHQHHLLTCMYYYIIYCHVIYIHTIHLCQGIYRSTLSYSHPVDCTVIPWPIILFQFMACTLTTCKFENKPLWVGTFLNEAQRQHDFMKNMNAK